MKDLSIGAGTWCLLAIPTTTDIGLWLDLAGKGVALITGVVMLFKHKAEAKDLLEMVKELTKKK